MAPASPFVARFVGESTRLPGGHLVRPHDIEIDTSGDTVHFLPRRFHIIHGLDKGASRRPRRIPMSPPRVTTRLKPAWRACARRSAGLWNFQFVVRYLALGGLLIAAL